MQVNRDELVKLCQFYGSLIKLLDTSIDPVQLLWAISGNESQFGQNINPRHEPGYCYITKGKYAPKIAEFTRNYGCLAHCSFGPWQLMASNSSAFTPLELLEGPEACAKATVWFLNAEIERQQAKTLQQIAALYNAGNDKPSTIVFDKPYVDLLVKNYNTNKIPLPVDSNSSEFSERKNVGAISPVIVPDSSKPAGQ